jgi:putative heme iron utilization protein
MSGTESTLNQAILNWMKDHGIENGKDCPVLAVTLVGFDLGGTPIIRLRPAFDHEIKQAMGDPKDGAN